MEHNSPFNESMSSRELRNAFWDYASQHRGENIDEVKSQYSKLLRIALTIEFEEHNKVCDSDYFGE